MDELNDMENSQAWSFLLDKGLNDEIMLAVCLISAGMLYRKFYEEHI